MLNKINKAINNRFNSADIIIIVNSKNVTINIHDFPELRELGRWIKTSGKMVRLYTDKSTTEIKATFSKVTGINGSDLTVIHTAETAYPYEKN